MAIVSEEIKFFKSSSGVGLGGAISNVEIVDNVLANIFDNVSSAEGVAGDVEHRCIYVGNRNALINLVAAVMFIEANAVSDDLNIEIGLGTSGINGIETPIAEEGDAPVGVVFSSAVDYDNGIALGTIPAATGHIAVWIRRTVEAGAEAVSDDGATYTVQGETTA